MAIRQMTHLLVKLQPRAHLRRLVLSLRLQPSFNHALQVLNSLTQYRRHLHSRLFKFHVTVSDEYDSEFGSRLMPSHLPC